MEALAAHEMVFGVGPAGTGKTYLAVAQAVAMLQAGKVDRIVLSRPAVEAGRAAGLPARRPEGEGRSLSAAALRRAARHDAGRAGDPPAWATARSRWRRWPSCAAARWRTAFVILDEAQNTTAGADEDVPDPHGRGHPHGDHRRPDARSICRRARAPACAMRWTRWRACRASASCGSTSATWCAIRWWRGSSRPMTSGRRPSRTRARGAPAAAEAAARRRVRWNHPSRRAPPRRGSGRASVDDRRAGGALVPRRRGGSPRRAARRGAPAAAAPSCWRPTPRCSG